MVRALPGIATPEREMVIAPSSEAIATHDTCDARLDRSEAADAMLRDIMDALPDAILAFDPQDRLLFTNAAYAKMFPDNAPFMVPGRSMEELVRVGMELGIYRDVGKTEADRAAWLARYLEVHRSPGAPRLLPLVDGRIVQAREVLSAAGNLVAVRTDVTRLQHAEAVIRRQAEFDALTDLLNRTALLDRLAAELRARRSGDVAGGAFVLMDIDHFKTINDTFGLDVGDSLLIEMARRLQRHTRRGDTVARLGSDEFGMLLSFSGQIDDPRDGYGPTLARLLLRMSEPVELAGRRLVPSVSMGVALYPHDGEDEQTLLKHANLALSEAKRRGRGRWSRFDPDASSLRTHRQELGADLRVALAEGRLHAELQPKLHLRDRAHAGFEVLARWSRDGEPVRPDVFIPIAEETGLIVPLGRAILALALHTARALLDRGLDPGVVAVNVAALQLTSDDFVEDVTQLLAQYGMPASRLEIEVTETVLLDRSAEHIERSLRSLRALGVRLALDDFGTGYASLVHLRRFPVQRLKIDKSFVTGMEEGSDNGVIVKAIVSMAHGLGLDVVAEGVETEAQFDYLRRIGCDDVQGYLIARPMPIDQVAAYLTAFASRARQAPCVWTGIAGA